MDLERKVIHKNKAPLTAFAQLITEEDYNLPEYKPDIMTIIKSRGTIVLDETSVEEEYVTLHGKMNFEILYQGEGSRPVIDCLKGSIPFQERVHAEGLQGKDNTIVKTTVEDMGVVVINSRKLSLRGLTEVQVIVNDGEEMELPVASEYPSEYQVQQENRTVLRLMEQKRDRMRFKQEVMLPKEKPNIQTMLWTDVRLEQTALRQSSDGLELTGMLCVFALYQTGQEEAFTWYESSVPVSSQLACELPRTDGFYQVKTIAVQSSLEPREDLDGELRNLAAECFVEVELSVWQEEQMELLKDAYCMSKELHVHRHTEEMWQIAMKNDALISFDAQQQLPGTKEALYLCDGSPQVKVQEVSLQDGNIVIRGTCDMEVLYLTTEDSMPLGCARFGIPFEGEMEAGNVVDGDYIDVEASVYRVQCTLNDSSTMTCRGELQVGLMAFHREQVQLPDDLVEEPLDLDALQKQPGMIGYVVRGKDELWDIAKRFHTTKQELMETNQLTQEELQPGQKLLVMKHIYLDVGDNKNFHGK